MSDLTPNSTATTRTICFTINKEMMMVQGVKRRAPSSTTFQARPINGYVMSCHYVHTRDPNTPLPLMVIKDMLISESEDFSGYYISIKDTHVELSKGNMKAVIKLERVTPNESWFEPGNKVVSWMLDLDPALNQYLTATNKPDIKYNLLPKGYGWDGKHSNSEVVRAKTVKQLIIGAGSWHGIADELITELSNESLYTNNRLIHTDWSQAYRYGAGDVLHIGRLNEDSKVYIFGQTKDTSTLTNIEVMQDDEGRNYFTPRDKFDRYVVVSTKVLENANYSNYGIRLKLYKRGAK